MDPMGLPMEDRIAPEAGQSCGLPAGHAHLGTGRPLGAAPGPGNLLASFLVWMSRYALGQPNRTMAKQHISKHDLPRIERTAVREERKEQGALDGRFRARIQPSKKRYIRKAKHPGRSA